MKYVLLLGALILVSCGRMLEEPKCIKYSTVKEIVSVSYRDSTFKDEEGNLVTMNQATYIVGTQFCTKYVFVKR